MAHAAARRRGLLLAAAAVAVAVGLVLWLLPALGPEPRPAAGHAAAAAPTPAAGLPTWSAEVEPEAGRPEPAALVDAAGGAALEAPTALPPRPGLLVTDLSGRPLPGACVIHAATGDTSRAWEQRPELATDAAGLAALPAAESGLDVLLVAAQGHLARAVTLSGTPAGTLHIELEPCNGLDVLVRTVPGTDMGRLRVVLESDVECLQQRELGLLHAFVGNRPVGSDDMKPSGRLQLRGLVGSSTEKSGEARVRIAALVPGVPMDVILQLNDGTELDRRSGVTLGALEQLTLELVSARHPLDLVVHVRRPDGSAAADLPVNLELQRSKVWMQRNTDATGHVRFPGLLAETVRVQVEAEGFASRQHGPWLVADSPFEVTLEPERVVTVAAVDERHGDRLAIEHLSVAYDDTVWSTGVRIQEGLARVSRLPHEDVEVEVRLGGRTVRWPVGREAVHADVPFPCVGSVLVRFVVPPEPAGDSHRLVLQHVDDPDTRMVEFSLGGLTSRLFPAVPPGSYRVAVRRASSDPTLRSAATGSARFGEPLTDEAIVLVEAHRHVDVELHTLAPPAPDPPPAPSDSP